VSADRHCGRLFNARSSGYVTILVSHQTAFADALYTTDPELAGSICSAEDFLKSIGRSAETKLKVEKWAELWKLDSSDLKRQGLDVKDRR
jgi:hypothetical protein